MIQAPPTLVWPWLVQVGCLRAGFYSNDLLDNLDHPSARAHVTSFPSSNNWRWASGYRCLRQDPPMSPRYGWRRSTHQPVAAVAPTRQHVGLEADRPRACPVALTTNVDRVGGVGRSWTNRNARLAHVQCVASRRAGVAVAITVRWMARTGLSALGRYTGVADGEVVGAFDTAAGSVDRRT